MDGVTPKWLLESQARLKAFNESAEGKEFWAMHESMPMDAASPEFKVWAERMQQLALAYR